MLSLSCLAEFAQTDGLKHQQPDSRRVPSHTRTPSQDPGTVAKHSSASMRAHFLYSTALAVHAKRRTFCANRATASSLQVANQHGGRSACGQTGGCSCHLLPWPTHSSWGLHAHTHTQLLWQCRSLLPCSSTSFPDVAAGGRTIAPGCNGVHVQKLHCYEGQMYYQRHQNET